MSCTIRRDPISGLEEWICTPNTVPGYVNPGAQPSRPTSPPPGGTPGGRPAPKPPPPPVAQPVAQTAGVLETVYVFAKKKKKLTKQPVLELEDWLKQLRHKQGYSPKEFGKPTTRSKPLSDFAKKNQLEIAKRAREKELLETHARDLAKKEAAQEAAKVAAKTTSKAGLLRGVLRFLFGVPALIVEGLATPLPTGSKELDEQPHDEFGRPIPIRPRPDSGTRVEPFTPSSGVATPPAPVEEIVIRGTKPRGSGNTYAPNGIAPDLGPIGQLASRPLPRTSTPAAPTSDRKVAPFPVDYLRTGPLAFDSPSFFPDVFPETKPQSRPAPKSPGKPGRFASPLTPPNPIGVPFAAGFPVPGPNPAPKGKPESDSCKKCKAEKPERKKRKPRDKCTRGTYTMKSKSIIYNPKETIPCQ